MRRWWRRAVCCLVAVLALAGQVAAEGQRTDYIVGVENLHYLPVSAVEAGRYSGFARELLDAFAEEHGYRFEYRPLPVSRLYASFFNGQVDFKFPDNPNWQSEMRAGRRVVYSRPVAGFIDGTLVPAGRARRKVETIGTLGTVTGFTPWAWLPRIQAGQVELRENSDFSALVRQVLSGRIDAAYASVAVVNHQLDAVLERPGALVFDPELPHARDEYHLSTIGHAQVIAAFDRWLDERKGFVQALKARHGVEKGVSIP